MRNGKLALALSLSLLAAPAAADSTFSSKPEFNERGQLVSLTRSRGGRFSLQIYDPSTARQEERALSLGPGASLPVLKKDALGRLWAVWAERNGERPKLALLPVRDGLSAPTLRDSAASPPLPWDCCLDDENHFWLAWVEEGHSRQYVRVRDSASGRSWTVSSGLGEANSPRLLRDAERSLWLFWTAAGPTQEQVFYSRFSGTAWTKETRLSGDSDVPNITPAVAADRTGNVWVVWSGYDGQDYEIRTRMWDGRTWLPAKAVTTNDRANDVFPSIDLAFGVFPVISWVRTTGQGQRAMIRYGQAAEWNDESELAPISVEQPFVPLALKDDLVGLAWQDRDSLRREWFFLERLARPERGTKLPLSRPAVLRRRELFPPVRPIYNPSLDENAYIGFGDSITYGVCDEDRIDDPGDYIPDKAYPPRLEAMLSQRFGPQRVINAGVPGESTIQGLARIDAVLARHLARYILILEGTNDIIWNWYSLETTSFNLEEMLRKSLEYGMLPALATTLPRFDDNADWSRQSVLNERIRGLAEECLVPLEDLYQDFANYPAGDGGVTSLYCWGEDRLHPNEKGYQFLAEKWFQRIIRFPFPPADATVRRATDKILFFRAPGNLVEWRDNPKIIDPAQIREYRIYRKAADAAPSAFRLLAAVAGKLFAFDSDIRSGETYVYVVSTVASPGVEGPATLPLSR